MVEDISLLETFAGESAENVSQPNLFASDASKNRRNCWKRSEFFHFNFEHMTDLDLAAGFNSLSGEICNQFGISNIEIVMKRTSFACNTLNVKNILKPWEFIGNFDPYNVESLRVSFTSFSLFRWFFRLMSEWPPHFTVLNAQTQYAFLSLFSNQYKWIQALHTFFYGNYGFIDLLYWIPSTCVSLEFLLLYHHHSSSGGGAAAAISVWRNS